MITGKAEIVKWSIRKVQRMILNCCYIVTSLMTTWHKITISDANIVALKKQHVFRLSWNTPQLCSEQKAVYSIYV